MKPCVKPTHAIHFPPTPGCPMGQLIVNGACKVPPFQGPLPPVLPPPSPCPREQALNDQGRCDFSPPLGGYLCAEHGFVFACGGINQPPDPCRTARTFVPDAVCLVDGVPVLPPEPRISGEMCPSGAVGLVFALILAWACL